MATATKKSKSLTPEVKAFIVEAVHSVLEDPDFGLELNDKFKRRLRAIIKNNKRQRYYSQEEVEKRFGLA